MDLTPFRSGMGAAASGARELLREPGDLGEERTTATFFTLLISALDEGDLGVPGLLSPLWVSVGRGGRSEGSEQGNGQRKRELKCV